MLSLVFCWHGVNLFMSDSQTNRGPGQGVIQAGRKVITTLTGIIETRLRLAVVEIEEEKARILYMLLMVGLALIFTAFGLMSLMILVIWAVDPEYRLLAIEATTGVLFILALLCGLLALRKSRKSTLLKATRKELNTDRKLLEDQHS